MYILMRLNIKIKAVKKELDLLRDALLVMEEAMVKDHVYWKTDSVKRRVKLLKKIRRVDNRWWRLRRIQKISTHICKRLDLV